jgi:hypothetical protein
MVGAVVCMTPRETPLVASVLEWSTWRSRALIACAAAGVLGLLLWAVRQGTSTTRSPKTENLATDVPVRVRPLVRPLFPPDSPEAVCINRLLQEPLPGATNVSCCCHLLRLYGLEPIPHSRFASGRDVVAALTDHKLSATLFGEPIFFQTRSGIRYRDPDIQRIVTGENHRDICLATFAELGLPLTTPMTTPSGSFSLRDLLRDSTDSFDINQDELAWTAIAYALDLAPQGGWANRDGESFTFDDLANALLRKPLQNASCGGTHLLYAMTVLWRVDCSRPHLSESVRNALAQRLRQSVTAAVAAQHKEGYWILDWHAMDKEKPEMPRIRPRDTLDRRLLATGHLLEWLELLPEQFQPPKDVYRRAARWLSAVLADGFRVTTSDSFCPPVHAACAVKALIEQPGG